MQTRITKYQALTLSAIIGILWGVVNQWLMTYWRTLSILGGGNGVGAGLLWLLALLTLLVLLAPNRNSVTLGGIAATFCVSAVLGYYFTYIVSLLLSNSTAYDLGDWSTYRGFWYLFRNSIVTWLLLGAVGGFSIGWLWGYAQQWRKQQPIPANK